MPSRRQDHSQRRGHHYSPSHRDTSQPAAPPATAATVSAAVIGRYSATKNATVNSTSLDFRIFVPIPRRRLWSNGGGAGVARRSPSWSGPGHLPDPGVSISGTATAHRLRRSARVAGPARPRTGPERRPPRPTIRGIWCRSSRRHLIDAGVGVGWGRAQAGQFGADLAQKDRDRRRERVDHRDRLSLS